jgi:hypothetical protein
MKKVDINIIKDRLKPFDYILIGEYRGMSFNSTLMCPLEHIFETRLDNFFNRNSRCPICDKNRQAKVQKIPYETVLNEAKKYNFTILTTKEEYEQNHKKKLKIKIICSCGNLRNFTWHELKLGIKCCKCGHKEAGIKKRWTIQEVSLIIKNKGYELISTEYTDSKTKLEILCYKHGKFICRFNDIHQGNGCPRCSYRYGEDNPSFKWTFEKIQKEALKYKTRSNFAVGSPGAYSAAKKMGVLDQVCSHMLQAQNTSPQEQSLFNLVKKKYPKTQKLRDRKVKIEGKSHIEGFDLDIYVPELRKGIEFDGTYWHSIDGLKRSRTHWPEEDLINYSILKDNWFQSKSIEILHIKEEDWLKDKQYCIDKCFKFLES